MSLDITVLDDQEGVIRSMGIGVDEHWEMVRLAAEGSHRLLGRLRDYYAEAEISVEELPAFLEEVEALVRRGDLSPRMRSLLTELVDMSRFAMAERRSLAVLPD
jgi:hypothetical protein